MQPLYAMIWTSSCTCHHGRRTLC